MLADNLKCIRKTKGLSQEELAIKIGVVRQTISKWEKGLSVPDSEILIEIAEALDTSVNVLLGETVITEDNQKENSELKAISSKLEVLNEQLAKKHERNRKVWRIIFLLLGVMAAVMLVFRLVDFVHYVSVVKDMKANENVIGWYDGPTSIYISSISMQMLGGIINIVVAVVAGIVFVGGNGVAYAATGNSLVENVKILFNGSSWVAEISDEGREDVITYTFIEEENQEQGGTEVDLTEEEPCEIDEYNVNE